MQAYGQAKSLTQKHRTNHKTHDLAIGFQAGAQTMFTPTINSPHLFDNHKYNFTKGVYLKKYWGNYFGLEASVNYSNIPKIDISENRNTTGNPGFTPQDKIYTITIPIVIQYYILPKSCKFRPYIGAGAVYCKNNNFFSPTPPISGDLINQPKPSIQCNSYISISVVQGITYEVNTKIQFNESLHFEPKNNCCNNTLGLSLGVGYKL
ncbi:MAG TPA: OmpW family outer membrane protein [Flavipsychrobacter sp.]|nr:OmpW family outer membrane protein [Flavipsychrobacter sp.]